MQDKTLDELYAENERLEELLKYAELFGGKIRLGDELVKMEDLKELQISVKAEIDSRISQGNLRLMN